MPTLIMLGLMFRFAECIFICVIILSCFASWLLALSLFRGFKPDCFWFSDCFTDIVKGQMRFVPCWLIKSCLIAKVLADWLCLAFVIFPSLAICHFSLHFPHVRKHHLNYQFHVWTLIFFCSSLQSHLLYRHFLHYFCWNSCSYSSKMYF